MLCCLKQEGCRIKYSKISQLHYLDRHCFALVLFDPGPGPVHSKLHDPCSSSGLRGIRENARFKVAAMVARQLVCIAAKA